MEYESSDEIVLQIGSSQLSFKDGFHNSKPIYHFAFTIAGNHFIEAKNWFRSKVELNKEGNDDEVYFKFLDAHSFYFHDPAGNVVEIIARNAYRTENEPFTINKVITISEINLTVDDVLTDGEKLLSHGFDFLGEGPLEEDTLNFIGDPKAYFLLGPKGRTWFFSHHVSDTYPVTVELRGGKTVCVDEKGVLNLSENL